MYGFNSTCTGVYVGYMGIDVVKVDLKNGNLISVEKYPYLKYDEKSAILNVIKGQTEGRISIVLPELTYFLRKKNTRVLLILMPGPCLRPPLGLAEKCIVLSGYIDPRGEILEDVDLTHLKDMVSEGDIDGIAIVSKFSIRRPKLERDVMKYVSQLGMKNIVMSFRLPYFNYIRRSATTIVSAKIRPFLLEFLKGMRKDELRRLFLMRGNGGAVPADIVLEMPAMLLGAEVSSLTMGIRGVMENVTGTMINIGRHSINIVSMKEGKVNYVPFHFHGIPTFAYMPEHRKVPISMNCKVAVSGDTVKVLQEEETPAVFGGNMLTVLDAVVYYLDLNIGDRRRMKNVINAYAKSRGMNPKDLAEEVLEYVVRLVRKELISMGKKGPLIAGGALSGHLVRVLAKDLGLQYVIPKHHEYINAIGAAISSLSLEVGVYVNTYDSRAIFIPSGRILKLDKTDIGIDDVLNMAEGELKSIARYYGVEEFIKNIRIVYLNKCSLIKENLPQGYMITCIIRAEPDIMVRING